MGVLRSGILQYFQGSWINKYLGEWFRWPVTSDRRVTGETFTGQQDVIGSFISTRVQIEPLPSIINQLQCDSGLARKATVNSASGHLGICIRIRWVHDYIPTTLQIIGDEYHCFVNIPHPMMWIKAEAGRKPKSNGICIHEIPWLRTVVLYNLPVVVVFTIYKQGWSWNHSIITWSHRCALSA